MSKKWHIPVTWQMCGVVTIEADTLKEAIDKVVNDDSIELPAGNYIDSSFEVSVDDHDDIRALYNNNQSDENRDPLKEQPSLVDQIESASTRAADSHQILGSNEKDSGFHR